MSDKEILPVTVCRNYVSQVTKQVLQSLLMRHRRTNGDGEVGFIAPLIGMFSKIATYRVDLLSRLLHFPCSRRRDIGSPAPRAEIFGTTWRRLRRLAGDTLACVLE